MTQQIDSNNFNATEELNTIQQLRATIRRKPYHKSRLKPHQAELVKLREAGGSFGDLQTWLRVKKRIKVDRSTIKRFLDKIKKDA